MIITANDIVSLFVFFFVWVQPVFWMFFFHVKTKKMDRLIGLLPFICVIYSIIMFRQDITILSHNLNFSSHRLYLLYGVMVTIFTWYLMEFKQWHFPQAISISALAVFLASFYWEAPYLIRNALRTGPESAWILHLFSIFPLWYIKDSVGWNPNLSPLKKLSIITVGLLVSTYFMNQYPVLPSDLSGVDDYVLWDAPHFLFNRVVASFIVFLLIHKENIPYLNEYREAEVREAMK